MSPHYTALMKPFRAPEAHEPVVGNAINDHKSRKALLRAQFVVIRTQFMTEVFFLFPRC